MDWPPSRGTIPRLRTPSPWHRSKRRNRRRLSGCNPRLAAAAATPVAAAALDALTPEERVNVLVYQQVNRSVVNINTRGVSGNALLFEIVSEGEGSGSVIDRDGHVLTNFHVVEGARDIHVTLFDGQEYDAKLVGSDPATDVAVLKIDAPADSLFPVQPGNSTNLLVGQRVFAIGNPFGLERTLTTGIISSLDRSLPGRHGRRSLKSIIQIDAAINPGNSGGPLLDSHGRMIGMNTAIASKTGESVGVGFAIPINTISRVVPQLIQNGRVRRPESGIVAVFPPDHGLLIATLVPGGPAERAGLRGPRIKTEQRRQGLLVYQVSIGRSRRGRPDRGRRRPTDQDGRRFPRCHRGEAAGRAGVDHGDPRRPAGANPAPAGSGGVI